MRPLILLTVLLIVSCSDTSDAPKCSVSGRNFTSHIKDLPPQVLKYFDESNIHLKMADVGEAFKKTDVSEFWEFDLPHSRLICGYPVKDGYVVEQENGGVAYFIKKLIFEKVGPGYNYSKKQTEIETDKLFLENCNCHNSHS